MQLSIKSAPRAVLPERPALAATAAEDKVSAGPTPLARRVPLRNKGWLRKLHAVVGLVASLNLLLLLLTGFMMQHREIFGLEERFVGRQFLPDGYRPGDEGEVRADIVVTDLHSGRLFGPTGALILDAVTLGWFVLLISGLFLYFVGRNRKENGFVRNGNGRHETTG